jgi:hypothetical protein
MTTDTQPSFTYQKITHCRMDLNDEIYEIVSDDRPPDMPRFFFVIRLQDHKTGALVAASKVFVPAETADEAFAMMPDLAQKAIQRLKAEVAKPKLQLAPGHNRMFNGKH